MSADPDQTPPDGAGPAPSSEVPDQTGSTSVPGDTPAARPDGAPGPAAQATPAQATPAQRAALVDVAVDRWARELVELGGRNTLLWYRDPPVGALDLTTAHPSGLAMLLAGRATRLSTLIREHGALADARRRARAIRAKTTELATERGLDVGWLAVGLATWRVGDGARLPCAPVLLRSCRLHPRGAADDDFDLDLGAAVELNPVLVEYLASRFDVQLDADVIAELALTDAGFDPAPVLERVAQTCRAIPGFQVEHRLVVSTFSAARLPLVTDLEDHRDTLTGHDVVAALAGDPAATTALTDAAARLASQGSTLAPAGDGDPASELLVLDADGDQQAVVDAVLAGHHLLVQAPPGTGAAPTIANLVAGLAATGRRTLLIAEKRAALDDVLTGLADVGLADLVLDLPDGGSDRRRITRDITQALDRAGRVARPAPDAIVTTVVERRSRLAGHVAALHVPREPWGVSAYDAQLALADLTDRRPAPRSRVRVRGPELTTLSLARLAGLSGELREAAEHGAFRAGPDQDPWFGAELRTERDAERALYLVSDLTERHLPQARQALADLVDEAGMPAARTLDQAARCLALIGSVRRTLDVFTAQVFDTSLADAVAATATRSWRAERGITLGWWQRRRLVRQARRLLRPGTPPDDLHAALELAHRQREDWQLLAGPGARPTLPVGLESAEQTYHDVAEPLGWLAERLTGTPAGGDLAGTDLEALAGRLELMAGRPASLAVLPRLAALRDRLRPAGLEPLIADLAGRDVRPEDVGSELDLVWWTSVLEHVASSDPRYGAHDGERLREAATEYAAADRRHLIGGAARVRRATAERLVAALDQHPEQAVRLRGETGRPRHPQSLRDLTASCWDVLAAAKPCWVMSPLVVSQVLPPGEWFDVVVLLEASQLSTARAVPAISRARQLVLVGDPQQLPPSPFTLTAQAEEPDPPAEHQQSVLDALSPTLAHATLSTQCTAADERLVTFANRHVYGGRLRTFPAMRDETVLRFEEVDGRGVLAPDADCVQSTEAEVNRVVQLVIEHARLRPHESLAVVALGRRHCRQVADAVRLALVDHPEAARALAARREPFLVKSVDRMQGEERDAVILTVGYGRTPHGRVLHRFGALNDADGLRLLNVAITRARRRLTVVASFGGADLDPVRLPADGARLLREFLSYVASGGQALAANSGPAVIDPAATPLTRGAEVDGPSTDREPTNPDGTDPDGTDRRPVDPLLADLARRLRDEGLTVRERYGSSSAPIDLVVGRDGGPPVVAVEADGPAYAAQVNSRERDRLRVEELQRRGWRHVRVWSTDVFRDPAREVARIRAAVAKGSASGLPSQRSRSSTASVEPSAAPGRNGSAAGSQGAVSADELIGPGQLGGPAVRWDHQRDSGPDPVAGAPGRAGPRPRVPTGLPIEQYTVEQLDAVVSWICSDTLLRTHDELATLVRQQLGLTRRGGSIDAVVDAAIARRPAPDADG